MRARVETDSEPLVIDDELLLPHRVALASAPPAAPVRAAWAAAHVVMQPSYADVPHSPERPGAPEEIAEHVDWDTTMALRRRLDGLGFGIAEAMDTAQRFQLGWAGARRLIEECGRLELAHGFVAGAGTDHVDEPRSQAELADAVAFQARVIQEAGGIPIVLPLPWLTARGADTTGYVDVYARIFDALEGPLFVHWLGAMFLPELEGYFPGDSFARVMALAPDKVRGAKLSLLDAELERRVRAELLPRGQVVLTGDDFHFAELILGEGAPPPVEREVALGGRTLALGRFSHALLGVLDGVAEPAGLALEWLARGDVARYRALMAPCEAFGQWVFGEPTRHYKTGLAFVSWLAGAQQNAMLVNHEERARDRAHLVEAARRANTAGVFPDAEVAAERLEAFLEASH